nr:immunoglobulin light chain junction region [Macaca mulatta]MOV94348.1 immunoglobulin light chain junction region [Macaca mulatta]MOV95363.1 immunoglobulin light chain junction region [Macaca mulatta]MOV95750.1 immunoglobulin light chain junction region [Macaca mulatta]MOV96070.1 immunoglobulin light chain junction region [Macaca mulatta]
DYYCGTWDSSLNTLF